VLSAWQRHADDCAGGCDSGHEVDAARPGVEGRPGPDGAPAPVIARIPAALLAKVMVAQVVSRPPGKGLLAGQVAVGQSGAHAWASPGGRYDRTTFRCDPFCRTEALHSHGDPW